MKHVRPVAPTNNKYIFACVIGLGYNMFYYIWGPLHYQAFVRFKKKNLNNRTYKFVSNERQIKYDGLVGDPLFVEAWGPGPWAPP